MSGQSGVSRAAQPTLRRMYPGPIMMRLIALAAFLSPVVFAQEQLIDWHTNYREALSDREGPRRRCRFRKATHSRPGVHGDCLQEHRRIAHRCPARKAGDLGRSEA